MGNCTICIGRDKTEEDVQVLNIPGLGPGTDSGKQPFAGARKLISPRDERTPPLTPPLTPPHVKQQLNRNEATAAMAASVEQQGAAGSSGWQEDPAADGGNAMSTSETAAQRVSVSQLPSVATWLAPHPAEADATTMPASNRTEAQKPAAAEAEKARAESAVKAPDAAGSSREPFTSPAANTSQQEPLQSEQMAAAIAARDSADCAESAEKAPGTEATAAANAREIEPEAVLIGASASSSSTAPQPAGAGGEVAVAQQQASSRPGGGDTAMATSIPSPVIPTPAAVFQGRTNRPASLMPSVATWMQRPQQQRQRSAGQLCPDGSGAAALGAASSQAVCQSGSADASSLQGGAKSMSPSGSKGLNGDSSHPQDEDTAAGDRSAQSGPGSAGAGTGEASASGTAARSHDAQSSSTEAGATGGRPFAENLVTDRRAAEESASSDGRPRTPTMQAERGVFRGDSLGDIDEDSPRPSGLTPTRSQQATPVKWGDPDFQRLMDERKAMEDQFGESSIDDIIRQRRNAQMSQSAAMKDEALAAMFKKQLTKEVGSSEDPSSLPRFGSRAVPVVDTQLAGRLARQRAKEDGDESLTPPMSPERTPTRSTQASHILDSQLADRLARQRAKQDGDETSTPPGGTTPPATASASTSSVKVLDSQLADRLARQRAKETQRDGSTSPPPSLTPPPDGTGSRQSVQVFDSQLAERLARQRAKEERDGSKTPPPTLTPRTDGTASKQSVQVVDEQLAQRLARQRAKEGSPEQTS